MKSTILILIIVLWTSCKTADKLEPEKIAGIPLNTFWVGGQDGGQWYEIKKINKDSLTVELVIYNDNTADIEVEQKFKLKCNSEKDFSWGNLKDEINGYDGQRIILKHTDKEGQNCYFE